MAQRSFTVGIPEELEQRIVVEARKLDITRNAFVRRALEAALWEPTPSLPATDVRPEIHQPVKDALKSEYADDPPSANFGSHERYGPRKPRGKPFQKS